MNNLSLNNLSDMSQRCSSPLIPSPGRERALGLGVIAVVVFMLPACLRDTSADDRTGSLAIPPAGEKCLLDKAKSWVQLQCDGDETRGVDLWHIDGWLHEPGGKLAALSLEWRIDSWQWIERACGSGRRPPESAATPLVLQLTASGFADAGSIRMTGTLLRATGTLKIGAEVERTGLQVRYVRSSRSCEAYGGVALRVPGTRAEHRIEFGLYGVAPKSLSRFSGVVALPGFGPWGQGGGIGFTGGKQPPSTAQ